jgi:hypothetical protein
MDGNRLGASLAGGKPNDLLVSDTNEFVIVDKAFEPIATVKISAESGEIDDLTVVVRGEPYHAVRERS